MSRLAELGKRDIGLEAKRLATLITSVTGAAGPHNILSPTHSDAATVAAARGDIIIADAVPEWTSLAIGAASTHLESDGADLAWQANLTMADDAWIGLGAAAGRLAFDSTPAPDQVEVTDADLNFVTTGHGIIHVDGVSAGPPRQLLIADGTRYVPGTLAATDLAAHNLLSAQHGDAATQAVSRGSLVYGDATPEWNELTHPLAAGYALTTDATDVAWDQTPTWTGNHTWDDGAGDSPSINFVGGSNDDTATIFLDDDATATDSDLIIRLCDADGDSHLIVQDSAPANVLEIDSNGNVWILDGATVGQAAGPLLTFDDGNDYLEITGCDVGIGLAAPSTLLHVYEDTNASVQATVQNPNAGNAGQAVVAVVADASQGSLMAMSTGYATAWRQDRVELIAEDTAAGLDLIARAAAGDMRFFTGGIASTDERMRIEAGGDVGVGTTNPDCILHAYEDTNATVQLKMENPNAGNAALATVTVKSDGAVGYLGAFSAAFADAHRQDRVQVVAEASATGLDMVARAGTGDLRLYTAGGAAANERMRIEADGDAVIGNTTAGAQLHVDQASTTGAQPVLYLDQADVSEEFIRFHGSAAVGVLTQSLVDYGDEASSTAAVWIKVYVVDDGNQVADQAYHILGYILA